MTTRKNTGHRDDPVILADRYRLETQVATGGMGEVWRATDMLLERTVAVKLLRESLAEDPVVSERFRREALMAARLSHPNMADVFDYVQEDGRPGIVMEYVEGETLAERIAREGALDVGDAVRITSALLAVLQVAHEAGIVHRDVKPGNVILSPTGEVKVTDFGIARAVGHETLTETGMVVGTAHYLSPEQVNGTPATPASDLYAVGAILYEMLTGAKPFDAETPLAVAMQRLTEDPAMPQRHRPDLPEPVGQVAMRALAREPAHRFGSADGMRTALESALASAQASVPTPASSDPTPTMMLPAIDDPDAPTVALKAQVAEPTPITGSSPAAAVVERRRRDYKRGIVWLLVLAFLVGGASLLLLALANSGPVTVPDFTGMQIAPAKARADELGLKIVEEPRESREPKGEVLDQNVKANTQVPRGSQITLLVSNGVRPCCVVPNLSGLTIAQARGRLRDAGLELGVVGTRTTEDGEPDTVIDQDPDRGVTEPRGSRVAIVVAERPPEEKRGEGRGNGNGRGNGD